MSRPTILSPSDWHDTAWKRDAGHDEMQIGIAKYLRTLPLADLKKIEIEFPFDRKGRVFCFADICEMSAKKSDRPDVEDFFYSCYEIKPRIDSIGAVIRQVKAFKIATEEWRPDWLMRKDTIVFRVLCVVPASDPKAQMLHETGEVELLLWNGERLSGPGSL
jgi:hypothetical protein